MFLSHALYGIALLAIFVFCHASNASVTKTGIADEIFKNTALFDYELTTQNFMSLKIYIAAIHSLEDIPNGHESYRGIDFSKFTKTNLINIYNEIPELLETKQTSTGDLTGELKSKYINKPAYLAMIIGKIFKIFVEKTMKIFIEEENIKTTHEYAREATNSLQNKLAFTTQEAMEKTDFNYVRKQCMALETIWYLSRIHKRNQRASRVLVRKFLAQVFKGSQNLENLPAVEEMREYWEKFRTYQIAAYRYGDDKILPNLARYVLKCDVCDNDYNSNEIKGPRQFNVAYDIHSRRQFRSKYDIFFVYIPSHGAFDSDLEYVKRRFFMGREYVVNTMTDITSFKFMHWLFGLMIDSVDFRNEMEFLNGQDVTVFFLRILQNAKIDRCFIGAIINYFSLLHQIYETLCDSQLDKEYNVEKTSQQLGTPLIRSIRTQVALYKIIRKRYRELKHNMIDDYILKQLIWSFDDQGNPPSELHAKFRKLVKKFNYDKALTEWRTYKNVDDSTAKSGNFRSQGSKKKKKKTCVSDDNKQMKSAAPGPWKHNF